MTTTRQEHQMTDTTSPAAPLVEFTRVGGTDGPEYRAETPAGTFRVRREATTYRVYLNDQRLDAPFHYLAEAQQYVRRHAHH